MIKLDLFLNEMDKRKIFEKEKNISYKSEKPKIPILYKNSEIISKGIFPQTFFLHIIKKNPNSSLKEIFDIAGKYKFLGDSGTFMHAVENSFIYWIRKGILKITGSYERSSDLQRMKMGEIEFFVESFGSPKSPINVKYRLSEPLSDFNVSLDFSYKFFDKLEKDGMKFIYKNSNKY